MDDHGVIVCYSSTKYIVGFPAFDGNHYKGGAHRLRTVENPFLIFFCGVGLPETITSQASKLLVCIPIEMDLERSKQ